MKSFDGILRAPRMVAVRQIERAPSSAVYACPDCSPIWGGLGLCKKHTHYHDIAHMGIARWAWVWVLKSGKMMVGTVLPFLFKVVVIVAFVCLFAYALDTGLQKQGLVACQKLKSYSQTYSPMFYLTKAEKAMCDDLNVVIDAPVK